MLLLLDQNWHGEIFACFISFRSQCHRVKYCMIKEHGYPKLEHNWWRHSTLQCTPSTKMYTVNCTLISTWVLPLSTLFVSCDTIKGTLLSHKVCRYKIMNESIFNIFCDLSLWQSFCSGWWSQRLLCALCIIYLITAYTCSAGFFSTFLGVQKFAVLLSCYFVKL